MSHLIRGLMAVILVVGVLSGCGGSDSSYEVTTTVASGAGTNDITVWGPSGDGPWPVVYAVPGLDGATGSAVRDFDVFADELASHGVVVIGTDLTSARVDVDVECGYRYAQEAGSDYGGDPSLPVTFLGYSAGATGALINGLGEDAYGPEGTVSVPCPPGTERPQTIVSLNGCHTTYTEVESRVRNWGNQDAMITLISGADDDVCPPRESIAAQELLTEAGYNAAYVEIPDANHWEIIFHDLSYGTYKTLEPDDPAGQATVQAVLDAIGISNE